MIENSTSCAHGDGEWAVAALYKFVTISDPRGMRERLADLANRHGLVGTLLVAGEGVNGTLAGHPGEMHDFLEAMQAIAEIGTLDIKHSRASAQPFHRLKVRLKQEIVTLGAGDLDPARNAGRYVEPQEWNALISDPDTIVIDTRNDYEVGIGTFENAINPETESFRDFPAWVDEKLAADPKARIAMFCTGGIRCEKSTALLKARGYENVHHLKGGILKYLEEVPAEESLWRGECFVFDQRVAVTHGLEEGSYGICHACRMPLSEDEMQDARYEEGISCPKCHADMDAERRARMAERQKQARLARERGERHIGADVVAAKAAKREKRSAAEGD